MDGFTPEYWVGTEYVPCEAPRCDGVDRHGNVPSPLLTALPHPAALVEWSGGRGWFRQWNTRFERSFFALTRSSPRSDPTDSSRFQAELTNFVLSGHDVSRFEIERMTPLGVEVFDCTLAWVRHDVPGGDRILISAIDRTADRRVEASLRRELISDSLTALPNRIGFGEFVEAALDRCSREAGGEDATIGVLIVDLVRFSRINEALGTMAGDELILAVASRLRACVGQDVLLGRLGGNDFGICDILTDGSEGLMGLAQRIKAAFETPVRLSNLEIAVDCAIGCSLMAVAEVEPDQLIRQAQTAARVAKTSGRLEIYRAGELGAARQRFFLESHLRDSLNHRGLHLTFQPIINLSTFSVTGFEALARWNHPILGSIPPTD
ncbi:MAG: hypothetical protein B7Z20_05460, partial [Sphingobium sp. 32-64-5]